MTGGFYLAKTVIFGRLIPPSLHEKKHKNTKKSGLLSGLPREEILHFFEFAADATAERLFKKTDQRGAVSFGC